MVPALLAIGAGTMGAGLLNSVLGKKKKASVDTAAMMEDIRKSTEAQKGIVGQQTTALQALNPAYESGMKGLGESYTKTATDLAKAYQTNLTGVGTAEQMAAEKAKALQTQTAARNIPLQQQLIRQQLAATGGGRTGQAAKALSAPVSQAATQASDFSKTLDIQTLQAQSARQEKGIDTLFQTQAGAALTKLGLDKETITTLLNNNRSDIILQAGQLLGIDQQQLANMLGIAGIQTNVNIANAAGYNANQAALNQALIGTGGYLVGKGL
jgi:hypothetical protein